MKFSSKDKMINSDSFENDSQMALTIGLFKAFKDALKIHAASEESDHSLDYSCTYSTTIDNKVIRTLLQNKVKIIAKNGCLEEVMDSLQTQFRKKSPIVSELPQKFGNPSRNNQSGRKALSSATNSVLDTVAGACFDKQID